MSQLDFSRVQDLHGNLAQMTAFWRDVILNASLGLLKRRYDPPSPEDKLNRALSNLGRLATHLLQSKWTLRAGEFEITKGESADWQCESADTYELIENYTKSKGISEEIYLVFDRFDQCYRGDMSAEQIRLFENVVLGLVHAVINLRTDQRTTQPLPITIKPVLCIRSDIFNLLNDPEVNRWLERSVHLYWTAPEIMALIGHRIAVADGDANTDFARNWRKLIRVRSIRDRFDKEIRTPFDFIDMRTCRRPRDYIFYLAKAAEHAYINNDDEITLNRIVSTEPSYADFLSRELADESWATASYVSECIKKLAQYVSEHPNKRNFTIDELAAIFECSNDEAIERARELFSFHVLGFKPKSESGVASYRFRHDVPYDIDLDIRQHIVIHPGMYRIML
jgi:hypothetical protein